MTQWTDVLVRDDLSDTGQYPNPSSVVSQSPDILPYGTTYLNYDQTVNAFSNFAVAYARSVVAQGNNYFYVRGRNLKSANTTAQVYLYWAWPSLLLLPSQWRSNQLPIYGDPTNQLPATLQTAAGSSQLGPNATCFSNQPFMWVAQQQAGTHPCLIARVVTTDHPNALPNDFGSTAAFITWVRNNPNVGWHNINVQNAVNESSYQWTQAFGNIDQERKTAIFLVTTKSLPVGTTIALSSPSLSADALGDPQKVSSVDPVISFSTQLAPGFGMASVVGTATLPGGAKFKDQGYMKISVKYLFTTTPADELFEFRTDRYAAGLLAHDGPVAGMMADDDLVQLGECSIEWNRPA